MAQQEKRFFDGKCTTPASTKKESNYDGSNYYAFASFDVGIGEEVAVFYNDSRPDAFKALGNLQKGETVSMYCTPKDDGGWSYKLTDEQIDELAGRGTPSYASYLNGAPGGGPPPGAGGGGGAPPGAGGGQGPAGGAPPTGAPPGAGGSAPRGAGQEPAGSAGTIEITDEEVGRLTKASERHAGLYSYVFKELDDALFSHYGEDAMEIPPEAIAEGASAIYRELVRGL